MGESFFEYFWATLEGGFFNFLRVIATAIGKDLIVRIPRMEIVWEPCFIINKRDLFSFII